MIKHELTAIGLYQHSDGLFYTHNWEIAFDNSNNRLYYHDEVDGSFEEITKVKSIGEIKNILELK